MVYPHLGSGTTCFLNRICKVRAACRSEEKNKIGQLNSKSLMTTAIAFDPVEGISEFHGAGFKGRYIWTVNILDAFF